jgi:hypothetical protein
MLSFHEKRKHVICLVGIAGLGTVGGRVYLVDLALDEANESTDVNMYHILFVGIARLGTVGGRVYLVDLALDEDNNESTDVNMYFVL